MLILRHVTKQKAKRSPIDNNKFSSMQKRIE